jgi:hypothetical protein
MVFRSLFNSAFESYCLSYSGGRGRILRPAWGKVGRLSKQTKKQKLSWCIRKIIRLFLQLLACEEAWLLLARIWSMKDVKFKISLEARPWWFTSVIPATQEAEIRKLAVQGQPWQIVHETPSPK